LLGSPSIGNVFMALRALNLNLQRYGGPQDERAWPKREPLRACDASVKDRLSSVEAAPLTTNQLALARLIGLKFLQLNSDAAAVELALPMLKDHNTLVRRRAFDVLHLLSEENISAN